MLPHTADVGLAASAESLPELFSEAVRGLAAIMLDEEPPTTAEEQAWVDVEADDEAALLAAVLSEALWLAESEGAVALGSSLEVLEGRAHGWLNAMRGLEVRGPQIKAVTYHQLSVAQSANGWRARVFFDV